MPTVSVRVIFENFPHSTVTNRMYLPDASHSTRRLPLRTHRAANHVHAFHLCRWILLS